MNIKKYIPHDYDINHALPDSSNEHIEHKKHKKHKKHNKGHEEHEFTEKSEEEDGPKKGKSSGPQHRILSAHGSKKPPKSQGDFKPEKSKESDEEIIRINIKQ